MHFERVLLHAPERGVSALRSFYGERIGETRLEFAAGEGTPFYHFALLVPGDRFDAAVAWGREHVELLPGGDVDGVIFDFEHWHARACYFHDAGGSIVELIAHRGVGESGRRGRFDWSELLGVSELGLVGDTAALAGRLAELGVALWDGSLEPGRLAFLGERARTLILAPPGRGWLPTRRQAEVHPLEIDLAGLRQGELDLGPYRVRSVP
jgi:hypothetical protein